MQLLVSVPTRKIDARFSMASHSKQKNFAADVTTVIRLSSRLRLAHCARRAEPLHDERDGEYCHGGDQEKRRNRMRHEDAWIAL